MLPPIRLLAALLLGLSAGLAVAAPPITVTDAWVRATPPGAPTAAAYLTISNDGTADRLLGATSLAAGAIELHDHVVGGGITAMRTLAEIPLPPGAAVELAPGGRHLMLLGLSGPLEPGTQIRVTLRFAHAGEVTLDVPVRDARTTTHGH